jgi:nucleotide-binding universal stress UspA family protein
MKTILIPTDFSEASLNAVDYAAEMALITGSKLILFHAYHTPVILSDVPYQKLSLEEIEKEWMRDLKKIKDKYEKKFKGVHFECICECGLAADLIMSVAESKKADLIIIGMQGMGYLNRKLFGSITTMVIGKAFCPVMAIGNDVKFRAIKNIVLANDLQAIGNKKILVPLKEFINYFKSKLFILNVVKELQESSVKQMADGQRAEDLLKDQPHSFHFVEDEDIIHGINEFVIENKIDMIVMIPHKHSLISRIFKTPNTKQMAFHAGVPLLALH